MIRQMDLLFSRSVSCFPHWEMEEGSVNPVFCGCLRDQMSEEVLSELYRCQGHCLFVTHPFVDVLRV